MMPLGTQFYAAPPAPVALPSGYSDFEEIWSSSTHPLTQDDEMKDFAWDIWNAYRAAMLQGADGNSPVIPDGYALVPVEPTLEMIKAGANAASAGMLIPGMYRAMITAVPRQEANP
ncbi:hypothetical protein [Enterobacter cloacae]|uniref:hypothetical protein n=1 Tax=Enterobacter cloacae TaxID=550 RepID=UPI001EE57D8C|nr:hypothetical protein [Enterobacter cloacae]UKW21257.1 hypothetical protein MBA36_05565 [Enterobacter cloacae]